MIFCQRSGFFIIQTFTVMIEVSNLRIITHVLLLFLFQCVRTAGRDCVGISNYAWKKTNHHIEEAVDNYQDIFKERHPVRQIGGFTKENMEKLARTIIADVLSDRTNDQEPKSSGVMYIKISMKGIQHLHRSNMDYDGTSNAHSSGTVNHHPRSTNLNSSAMYGARNNSRNDGKIR